VASSAFTQSRKAFTFAGFAILALFVVGHGKIALACAL
jgi:hypothetical protein